MYTRNLAINPYNTFCWILAWHYSLKTSYHNRFDLNRIRNNYLTHVDMIILYTHSQTDCNGLSIFSASILYIVQTGGCGDKKQSICAISDAESEAVMELLTQTQCSNQSMIKM